MTREQLWSHRVDVARVPRRRLPLVVVTFLTGWLWTVVEDARAWRRG